MKPMAPDKKQNTGNDASLSPSFATPTPAASQPPNASYIPASSITLQPFPEDPSARDKKKMAAGSLAMPALIVALLACATARVALVAGGTGTACIRAVCAMGDCKEVTVTVPLSNFTGYECGCYPGWSWPNVTLPWPLPPHLYLPCAVPTCLSTAEFTCYRPKPPNAANASLDNPCSYNDCGSEGTCVREEGHQFRCQCNPGATNVKGIPSLPCITCATDDRGCPVSSPTPPPPPPPSSSTPPPGNANGAPSSNKGSLSSRNRLRLSLLLASLAALHAVIV